MLSGQPKGGVSVEARSVSKGYFEETVTDSSGYYRLRGLLPDTVYEVKVAKRDTTGNSNIERASPDSISVKVSTMFPFTISFSFPVNMLILELTFWLEFPGWN